MSNYETMVFGGLDKENKVRQSLLTVYEALKVKGYNPISQLVGYIMSGDPTYITSHNNARSIISKLERDEILEEVFREYLKD
ncbi:MAG: IreB family regulatory phosphoprotein [Ruminococcaceae bacterium]|nr:IreB family regulatory phosphoprotein [Oscillospiraceae bacterium]